MTVQCENNIAFIIQLGIKKKNTQKQRTGCDCYNATL